MQIFAETERLILREMLPTDVDGMFQLDSDANVHAFLGNRPVNSMEAARQTIDFIRQQYINNGIGRWAAVEKATGLFIGWAGLKLVRETINGHTGFYDVGYRLLPQHWGKGFATEAAKASVAYAFGQLKLPRVYAMAHINNMASQQVLRKTGFQLVQQFVLDGMEHVWMEMGNPLIDL